MHQISCFFLLLFVGLSMATADMENDSNDDIELTSNM